MSGYPWERIRSSPDRRRTVYWRRHLPGTAYLTVLVEGDGWRWCYRTNTGSKNVAATGVASSLVKARRAADDAVAAAGTEGRT